MVASCCGSPSSRNTSMRRAFEMNYGPMASDYTDVEDALRAAASQGATHVASGGGGQPHVPFYIYGRLPQGLYKQALFRAHGRWHLGRVEPVSSIPASAETFASLAQKVRQRAQQRFSSENCEDCIGIHTHTPVDAQAIAKAIRGSSEENPRPFYGRRHYFSDIKEALVDQFNFTKRQAQRALDMYRRDIHEYFNYGRPAGFTAGIIARYFPG